jgi:hypothetical protein
VRFLSGHRFNGGPSWWRGCQSRIFQPTRRCSDGAQAFPDSHRRGVSTRG